MGQLVVKFKDAFQHAISCDSLGKHARGIVWGVPNSILYEFYGRIINVQIVRANPLKWINNN